MYIKLLKKVQKKFSLSLPQERRRLLINSMRDNEEKGNDCLSCSGRCCTFQANSMRMTNLEALEALAFLEEENKINDETIERIDNCIEEYRLSNVIQIGKGDYFRKTYTCPFFNYPSWGCSLGAKNKPYGCIAFNPLEKDQKDGGNCQADLAIQTIRNNQYEEVENEASEYIARELGVIYEKESIPQKLKDFLSKK